MALLAKPTTTTTTLLNYYGRRAQSAEVKGAQEQASGHGVTEPAAGAMGRKGRKGKSGGKAFSHINDEFQDSVTDKYLMDRAIAESRQVLVHCYLASLGCQWSGPAGSLPSHVPHCPWLPFECPECRVTLPQFLMMSHLCPEDDELWVPCEACLAPWPQWRLRMSRQFDLPGIAKTVTFCTSDCSAKMWCAPAFDHEVHRAGVETPDA